MKGVLALLMISLSLLCQGQGNLVPNGGFEDLVNCPTSSAQIHLATPWINDIGGCDLFNECSEAIFIPPDWYLPQQGVPENSVGFQFAHSGNGYAGIYTYGGEVETNGREYLQVSLSQTLVSGKYVVSFWASLADEFQYAVGSLGAYFSDTLMTRTHFNTVWNVEPSIQSPAGLIMSDKNIWYHITDTFVSRTGGEEYLLIGNFKSAEESDTLLVPTGANNGFKSYYYIDDVSVVALDTVSGIEEAKRLRFSIYPNPTTEIINIEGKGRLNYVQLLDIRGREIMAEEAIGQKHTLDLRDIPEGIYLLRVADDEGRTGTQRLVKLAEP